VPKKVEQINDYLLIDTYKSDNIKMPIKIVQCVTGLDCSLSVLLFSGNSSANMSNI